MQHCFLQMLDYFYFLLSFLTYSQKKSLLKEIPFNLTVETHFSKNSLKLTFLNFHQKNVTAFIFTQEILLKNESNQQKKKARQKTEIAFNFTREIPLKMNRIRKKRFTKKLKLSSFYKGKSI